jgi:hypothetical protein
VNFLDPDGLMILPGDPSGLPPGWTPDPTDLDPNGQRFKDAGGRSLDWHPGQPGKPGWRGKDHWHDPCNFGKKHLPPGTEIPDPVMPVPPWWKRISPRWPGPFIIIIVPPGAECIFNPGGCADRT